MKVPSIMAVACTVAALPMLAGSAAAAPLAPNLALANADTGVVQEVQYRRGWRGGWRSGRWIGPAAGFAAGVAVGSALARPYAYDYGAYAYAPGYSYDPGYAYVAPAPRVYVAPRYGYRSYGRCGGDEGYRSAEPSWSC